MTLEQREALTAIIHQCWQTAEDKGWHPPGPVDGLQKLCLIHSEVSEAVEAWRDPRNAVDALWLTPEGKPEGVPAELADVVIRCFDFAQSLGIDLAEALEIKMTYNDSRSHRHGGKRA